MSQKLQGAVIVCHLIGYGPTATGAIMQKDSAAVVTRIVHIKK